MSRAVKIKVRILSALAVLAAFVVAAPAAQGQLVWKISGAGFGHGVGMSQYGAGGFARHGYTWPQILGHYYPKTSIRSITAGGVRVLLLSGQTTVDFAGVDQGCGYRLYPGKDYRARLGQKGIELLNAAGKKLADCGDTLEAGGEPSFTLGGKGEYRGMLGLRRSGSGGLDALNTVDIEDYVRGVVASEMPSRFPPEALRAQAVAARSYALAEMIHGGDGYTLNDDTRSQVYGGVGAETAVTDQAVADTARLVVAYGDEIATTYFFSTSGGHTENVENAFGGDAIPYLRGVPDPYDGASPYHRWTETLTPAEMESALSGLVKGSLEKIDVTKRGASPRILSADLVGSDGTTTVSGETLASRLGLRDRWAYFDELHVGPEAKPARFKSPWQPL
jgi:stage II sporulation protein D